MAQNMQKIAEVKLSSCGLRKKLRLRNCGVVVAEQHFFKSCGIAIAEVLPSSCGIAIADSKKSCACPPLPKCHAVACISAIFEYFCVYVNKSCDQPTQTPPELDKSADPTLLKALACPG
jgi:hypothetical protein